MSVEQIIKNLYIFNNELSTIQNKQLAIETLVQIEQLSKDFNNVDKNLIKEILNLGCHTNFLSSLAVRDKLYQWAELAFKMLQYSEYTLLDMFQYRVKTQAEISLFREPYENSFTNLSYEKIDFYTKEIATALNLINSQNLNVRIENTNITPKVAIFSENSPETASVDLACLFYDILVTPLNINFDSQTLIYIFNELDINIVVTDTRERVLMLEEVAAKINIPFKIIVTNPETVISGTSAIFLGEYIRNLSYDKITETIENRKRFKINDICTIMFTSGSTGMPKGLCFNNYNLTSKRFARGAALPFLGKNEMLLCYLPLYHTFGRYLEMLGTIYWKGTYTFTGNTSKETLVHLFKTIEPTIFISIPLRWQHLYEEVSEKIEKGIEINQAISQSMGKKFKWGLSAAGYLDSAVFSFFNNNGINLSSGFGMTEATGGITMTPPGEYIPDSVGLPLPGVNLSFSEESELIISGHYIARYLDMVNLNNPLSIDTLINENKIYTGDVFKIIENGHYKIIDRIKDIYKNNKGQTIAPKSVEDKFIGVPGIKRTFLVGDGKPYNVLFIVPAFNEPMFKDLSEEQKINYFKQLIHRANFELAPPERIVNFKILNNDFSIDAGELTPKDSFNRKIIEKNYSKEIDLLYTKDYIILEIAGYEIKIDRWFFRDLGILEDEIVVYGQAIVNKANEKILSILPLKSYTNNGNNSVKIGDLEYELSSNIIDLSLFARQPKLWLGNPELINFIPLRSSWDIKINNISSHIFIPFNKKTYTKAELPDLSFLTSGILRNINMLISTALFANETESIKSIKELEELLKNSTDENISFVIRRRLEALARHPNEEIRCEVYKILLLDEPTPDYSVVFPAFLMSGLSFINARTVNEIASGQLERRRLQALRKRLHTYRQQLDWNNERMYLNQFESVFRVLLSLVEHNPDYYSPVRYEFANWFVFNKAPLLAKLAEKYFNKLFSQFEKKLEDETASYDSLFWNKLIIFDDNITKSDEETILDVIVNSAFLKESIILAFDEYNFELNQIRTKGLWISKLYSPPNKSLYRFSLTLQDMRHFELQVTIDNNNDDVDNTIKTIYEQLALAGNPYSEKVLPKFGVYRQELKAQSKTFLNELSAWDKIRQLVSLFSDISDEKINITLERIYIEAFSCIFKAWFNGNKEIVPGLLIPENIYIGELDFTEGATLNSLDGWKKYTSPLDLILPIYKNFYLRTLAHYPILENHLKFQWIFDALYESLNINDANTFLNELVELLRVSLPEIINPNFLLELNQYIKLRKNNRYLPLKLSNAIRRYKSWERQNSEATTDAKEQTLLEIASIYNLNKYDELCRYCYYRHTYFENADNNVKEKFALLLKVLNENPHRSPRELVQLSDLQASIAADEDRRIFSRMIFPAMKTSEKLTVMTSKEHISDKIIIQSICRDKYGETYFIREPLNTKEIAQLYRLFFQQKFPKLITEEDNFYIISDKQQRIIGGLCYKLQTQESVQIDGSVIAPTYSGRGIGSAALEDFCNRMASAGIKVVKTHFFLQNFYLKRGFVLDKRWGALVRFLDPELYRNISGDYCQM